MKRKKRQPAEDRLSALPDDMLHCILSHLASDQAVRTSTLSRRWRDVYEAVPVVHLADHKRGRRPRNISDKVKVCFDQQVTGAILCKTPGTPIRTLRLDVFRAPHELLDQWIVSAVSSGAEEIGVNLRCWRRRSLCPFDPSFDNYREDSYIVKTHHQLFGCPTLRQLRLTNWKLDLPLGVLMTSLETLRLERIMDPNGLLQQLLANCPRLADLTLQECPNLTTITVTSTHLRSFAMICCHHAQRVNLHSQCLKSLHYKGSLLPRKSLFELANYAGVVALSIEICQDLSSKEVDPVTTLISQCTQLTCLHLSFRPSMDYNCLLICAVRCLSSLRQLGLQGCLRDEDDVRSVIDFLCDTPNLEVLSLFPLGPRAPKKREYFSDSESDDELDDELQDDGVDYSVQVTDSFWQLTDSFWQLTDSFWPVHIRSLDDKLRRINIGSYKGLQLQKILAKFLLSRSASLEEFSVTLAAGCSRRKHIRELRSWRSNPHTKVTVTIQQ